MRYAITISAAANRLECHMHWRAGPPPGKDDAVQPGRARDAVCTALDERGERVLIGLDLSSPSTGLWRVSADGGEPTALTTPDRAQHEGSHAFPSMLPGGRGILFTIASAGLGDNSQVAVLDLKTGQRKALIRGGGDAQYVETGHLIFAAVARCGPCPSIRSDSKCSAIR